MKRNVLALTAIVSLFSGLVFAQTNNIYSEVIQIKSDNAEEIAKVDVNGSLTINPKYSAETVVNLLIKRMIAQNIQYKEQTDKLVKIIDEQKMKAQISCTKAAEIFQTWNPQVVAPAEPVKEVKKEEPAVVAKPITVEVKPVEKKSFWSTLGGDKNVKGK